jgi:enoyl-CoA hydratase/carnithine racemase
MGLNETKLGVPVPYLAHCVLHSLVGERTAREVVEGGQFYPPEEALKMGLVDEVLALDQVRTRSVERARQLAAIPSNTYATIKDNRIAPTLERLRAHGEDKQRAFIDCWYAPQARQRLQEALKDF